MAADPVLPAVWRRVMDDPVSKPSGRADLGWSDIVYDLVHLVHELALADIKRLQEIREEMVRRGIAVPPVKGPDKES